ncbi:MAG: hypothetical protein ACREFX_10610 [Opitutaceae bacterium]
MRLLSFLTEIERALQADDPSPLGGSWESARSVNYHQGLARLTLGARKSGEAPVPLGAILIQEFRLADGSICLKSRLGWAGAAEGESHAIYESPETLWSTEARRVASLWQAGREKVAGLEAAEQTPLVASA